MNQPRPLGLGTPGALFNDETDDGQLVIVEAAGDGGDDRSATGLEAAPAKPADIAAAGPEIHTTAPFAETEAANEDACWLGHELLREEKITREQLAEAIRTHRKKPKPGPFSDTLEMLQLVNPQHVAKMIAERYELPYIEKVPIQRGLARRVSQGKARAKCFLPFSEEDDRLHIAVADPAVYGKEQASLDFPEGAECEIHVTPRKEVLAAIEIVWSAPVAISDPAQYIDRLLLELIELNASDVHFEPKAESLQIRRRVDGVLTLHENVAETARDGVIQALKIKARMDISERRMPQDGRFKLVQGARGYSFRVSTLPLVYGEKVVLRISDDNSTGRPYQELGMEEAEIQKMEEVIKYPHGAILLTGPAGAGKSTLMFSAISTLPLAELNVVSIEDPVEYMFPGINQISVNTQAGLTAANALRHILRQDPDVLIVGEMRDLETASLAIKAALTGHLCLATLHTNNAPGAITRMVEMGVEPYLVASAVRAVVAQRLVKRLCQACKRVAKHSTALKAKYGIREGEIYEAGGCPHCRGTGYSGRIGIFEIMVLQGHGKERDDELRQIIMGLDQKDSAPTESDLLMAARSRGMRTLWEDGLRKVAAGITSLEEVLSETWATI